MRKLMVLWVLALTIGAASTAFAQAKKKYDYLVVIETPHGEISIRLFDDTPKHKANFIKLAQSSFYDSTTFYRVLKDYVIQGGDPNTKPSYDSLPDGFGSAKYELDAEIMEKYKPKRGMIGAARLADAFNPYRKSSGSQFFIVQNDEYTDILEGGYTLFGEVVSGMDVVDKIADETPVDGKGLAIEKVYLKFIVKQFKAKKFKKMMLKKYQIKIP